jgi:hypothetical protein
MILTKDNRQSNLKKKGRVRRKWNFNVPFPVKDAMTLD